MYRVILVDDEVWVINGLMHKVCWSDYFMEVVGTATDGIEAARLASSLKPHLMITDLRMPGADGLNLIKVLHDLDPSILCVILTGYDYFTYTQQALRLGVFDYLLKPIDPDNIEDVLIRASKRLRELHSDQAPPESVVALRNEKTLHAKVARIVDYINDYYQQDLFLNEVAERFDINPSYLSDIFRRTVGLTFVQYICKVRTDKAMQLLQYTNYTMETISQRTGFKDYHHFIRSFKRTVGITPTQYRDQCKEESLL